MLSVQALWLQNKPSLHCASRRWLHALWLNISTLGSSVHRKSKLLVQMRICKHKLFKGERLSSENSRKVDLFNLFFNSLSFPSFHSFIPLYLNNLLFCFISEFYSCSEECFGKPFSHRSHSNFDTRKKKRCPHKAAALLCWDQQKHHISYLFKIYVTMLDIQLCSLQKNKPICC